MLVSLIVLAAGRGTRMVSDIPKVLHPIAGAPLLFHAMQAGADLDPDRIVIVAGYGADLVETAIRDTSGKTAIQAAEIVIQDEQLGTAHAADQARETLADFTGDVIVLLGDTPFVRPETLRAMQKQRQNGSDVVVLGFEPSDPGRYGRLVLEEGHLRRIVEASEASPEELQIGLCNSGVICADSRVLFDLISQIGRENAGGEYYLTDIVGLANEAGLRCGAVICDEVETLGINSRAQLAQAEAIFQARTRENAMAAGVTLTAPDTVFFAFDTVLGRDVVIEPHVVFGPGVTVADGAVVRAFSHLEGCVLEAGATVGPYARLRPGSVIGAGARVGNFVETKNARLGAGAKAGHLSYLGDVSVGARANIGAGTITCNYDGVMKHRTDIGADAFIGSNSALVAPVSIGGGAMVGAGSVITADIPAGALSVSRAPQSNKPGLALRLRKRLLAIKAGK